MKLVNLSLIIILFQTTVWSQGWQEVNQDYFGMIYKLPEGWEIDGFGGNNWEEYGSSVCNCAGTINIGNRYQEDEIYMVVYPSRNKDSILNAKRQKVWDMEFNNITSYTEIKNRYCVFRKKISSWKDNTQGNYTDITVWQLSTNYKKQYYLLYFWGKSEVINQNETLLLQIIDSFKPIKTN